MATESETKEVETTPADVDETPEMADELNDDDFDVPPPPEEDVVPEAPPPPTPVEDFPPPPTPVEDFPPPPVEEEKVEEPVEAAEPAAEEEPNFAKYKTNVAERLWRAAKAAENAEVSSTPDLLSHTQDYQEWRHKLALLNNYLDEYAAAMQTVSEKRDQLFKQYALLTEGTPLWDHVGKPLTEEQVSEMTEAGDLKTLEGIEARTNAIMKVAEDIGPGSLMQFQQLNMMQDELNKIDFKNHNAKYFDEWDTVVTAELDDKVKDIREVSKERQRLIAKVDKLREKVNKIEHKGKNIAPKKLSDQLARNETKLSDIDAVYEAKAHECSVVLYEATQRGWVDLYPVMKNVMKFEINRLGRESSCYGSYHTTLAALKEDYREATKGTPDAPLAGSAL